MRITEDSENTGGILVYKSRELQICERGNEFIKLNIQITEG